MIAAPLVETGPDALLHETWTEFLKVCEASNGERRMPRPYSEAIFTDLAPKTLAGVVIQLRYSMYCRASEPWLEAAALGGGDPSQIAARLAGDDAPTEALWSAITALEAMSVAR